MSDIFLVSIGAILGANIRFKIHNKLVKLNFSKYYLILIINTFSSFCVGLFLALLEQFRTFTYYHQLVLFFSIGFFGSLSTFSSFIYDLFDLCLQLEFFRALKLFIISASIGIIAVAFGFFLGNQ
ncbi:CrcB family protein [Prochlorococcus sp. MIT 0801]|uniref:fluoride efflux transporter FluC n=1 Tax=Prochlorococcus sp. MIT 0801 TaxID=1501269 RepID=UPI0004F7D7B8|nr:CrcB family protein [Prochlorococcus sp. MIT 0801]AIQ98249.1 hypothetical protein EW15_2157 [Prochlorococcus sp. MIT 0801]